MTAKIGYLLIDGMNLAHASNAGSVLTAGTQQTQAIYGTLRSIRKVAAAFPVLKPIVMWDGPNNWRKAFYPDYKANRDKPPETKHEIESAKRRAELPAQLKILKTGLRLAGISQLVAMNLEADDLAGILSRRYLAAGRKVMLVSGDRDWHQLVRPGVGQMDIIRDLTVTYATFETRVGVERKFKDKITGEPSTEWIGCPSPQAHLECKALQGDDGDNIPGVGGVGEIGALQLVRQFGTVKNFFEQVEIHKIKVPKKLADFCSSPEKRDIFYRNLHLMDLAHPDIPAPQSMLADFQPLDKAGFADFCGEYAFKTMLTDLDAWLAPIHSQI